MLISIRHCCRIIVERSAFNEWEDNLLDVLGQTFIDNQTKYNSEQAEGGRVRQAQELGGGRKDCMGWVKPQPTISIHSKQVKMG